MKKIFTILAITMSMAAFAQTGLKILSSIPTNQGMKSNIEVKFSEFYLNKSMKSQFAVFTQVNDSTLIETFIVDPVFNFQLSAIPTIQIMWDSVAVRLRAKGLIVNDL